MEVEKGVESIPRKKNISDNLKYGRPVKQCGNEGRSWLRNPLNARLSNAYSIGSQWKSAMLTKGKK